MTPCTSNVTPGWRRGRRRHAMGGILVAAAILLTASSVSAQSDQIYFPAVDNVTSILVSKINAETVRIDMSAWYLSEHAVSVALIDARNRGVQIRLIGDRGAIFEIDTRTKTEFYWLASQGIPIRLRYNPSWFPEIDHMKMTVFKGQGLVSFGSANYTPFQLAPFSSTNYCDETVMFSTDPALVGAFLTRFDQIWNDTTPEPQSLVSSPPYLLNWNDACAREAACADYATLYPNPAPMSIDTARLEPNYPTPPDLMWGQGTQFNDRVLQEINNESSAIKFVIYRLTVDNITNALLARFQAGVPTQLIIEPAEYLNSKWPEFWLTHANIDKLWAAGVPIKQRQHAGLTHMKMLVTSSYATNASSNFTANWQRDNDYFVSAATKPAIYSAMRNRFDAMWNDPAGFVDFTPQPPDKPVLSSPALGASGVSQTPRLTWNAAPFATSYDVYLGASSSSMVFVGNVPAQLVQNPPSTYAWTASSALTASTTFYWRVVARTNATGRDSSLVASSDTWSFATGSAQGAGTSPTPAPDPPPPPAPTAPGRVPGDFDHDGKADLVWQLPTGSVQITTQNSVGGYSVYYGNTDWKIAATGDLNGDGNTDLVWQYPSGQVIVGWMNGPNHVGDATIFSAPTAWKVVGAGDFNGDGKDDLVWQYPDGSVVVTLLDGARMIGQRTLSGPTNWVVAAVGRFAGDSSADLVWQRADGPVVISLLGRGTQKTLYSGGTDWKVVAVGDMNADGEPDLVWQYPTGAVATWWMSGTDHVGDGTIYGGETDWRVR